MIKVIGIKIIDRIKEAGLTQEILSRHPDLIISRLGFHEVTDAVCSREACIILHLKDNMPDEEKFFPELQSVRGIEIRTMTFTHEKEAGNSGMDEDAPDILGILVERDRDVVAAVQRIFTAYGCNIRTRLGVNESFFGEPAGLIILELKGDDKQRLLLEKELKALSKVYVRTMSFNSD